jgi:hypothetical protein
VLNTEEKDHDAHLCSCSVVSWNAFGMSVAGAAAGAGMGRLLEDCGIVARGSRGVNV